MELKTTRGVYMTIILLNMHMLLQALPMNPSVKGEGDIGNSGGTRSGTSTIPIQFRRYAEIFDIITRLKELQEEINNVHPSKAIGHKDNTMETSETDLHLFNNRMLVGHDLDNPQQPMNNKPLLEDEENIDIMETNTDADTSNIDKDLFNEVLYTLNEDGGIERESNTFRKRSVSLSNTDLSGILGNICTTAECLKQLEQYIAWRQKNGYPGYTGVWKVGK